MRANIPTGPQNADLPVLQWAANVACALHTLYHSQRELTAQHTLLEVAESQHQAAHALTARRRIERAVHRQRLVSLELLADLIQYDGAVFGVTAESLGEISLRGVMFVVNAQLYRLRQTLGGDLSGPVGEPVDLDRVRALFADDFAGLDEMTSHLRRQFDHINEKWVAFRAQPPPCARPLLVELPPMERAAGYRCGVRDAQRELLAVPRDPRVAAVLRRCNELGDWPAVQVPAAIIGLVLRIHLRIELAPALLLVDGAGGDLPSSPPEGGH
jgi:hypothetical protein